MIHKVTAECIKSFRVLLSNEAHGLGVVGLNWTGSMTCGSFDVSVIGTDTLKYKMAQTHTHTSQNPDLTHTHTHFLSFSHTVL